MSEFEPLGGVEVEVAHGAHVLGHTMGEQAEIPEPPPLEGERPRAWPANRVLAILVVVATLVAAGTGYLPQQRGRR
jgi:hypothetical protein